MTGGTRVDYWRDTLIKRAFIGSDSQGGVAAQYSVVQLWNPAASGKMLICDTIHISLPAASNLNICHHNATLTGAGTQGNKYLNEAAGVGVVKSQAIALTGTILALLSVEGGKLTDTFKFKHPFVIGEGLGLHLQLASVNILLTASFEWIEV